jgi:hypothetical protein
MLKALSDGVFQVGYGLYKTRIGQSVHDRTCAETREVSMADAPYLANFEGPPRILLLRLRKQ